MKTLKKLVLIKVIILVGSLAFASEFDQKELPPSTPINTLFTSQFPIEISNIINQPITIRSLKQKSLKFKYSFNKYYEGAYTDTWTLACSIDDSKIKAPFAMIDTQATFSGKLTPEYLVANPVKNSKLNYDFTLTLKGKNTSLILKCYSNDWSKISYGYFQDAFKANGLEVQITPEYTEKNLEKLSQQEINGENA